MPVKERSRKSATVATPTDAHLYQQPTEELLLQLVGKEMYSKWNPFGVYLGIKQNVRDGIKQQTQGDPEACFIKLCSKWLYSAVGTGEKPRTWKTVLNAVRDCEYPQVADDAEKTLVLRLTKADVAVLCIDKYNDQLVSICLAKKTRHLKELYLLSSLSSNGLCPRSDVVLHHHIIKELKEAMKRDHENMDVFCTFLRLEFSGNATATKIASDMKGDFDRGTSSLKYRVTNFIEDNRDPVATDTEGCLRSQNRDEGYITWCTKNGWIVSGTFATAIVLLAVIAAYVMKGSGLQDESVPNIPSLPTAFTGRSEDVENILNAFLQKQIQVVAITGGPGYGKSSLAIVCAHKLARKGFNVHHILLNEVNTTVRLTSKVLVAFDELHSDKQLEDTLLMQIKALKQTTVLILDNADQLTLETSSTMSSFLVLLRKMTSTSSLLKMIVTTRYRFNMIDGFRQIHLQALSNNCTIDLLSSLLLTSSGSKSSPATNSFHIQQIANLTGGIPLAVKVVCQLLNSQVISMGEVVEGLSIRPVHTLSHETFSPEERLNRCFNLSYSYLSKPAKLCFVYASRFPDAFSTEAGRAIVANLSTDLECLPKLVDRSLLEYDIHTKRYSMHLLLRHFVQEQESVRKNNIRKWKFWKLYVNFYVDNLLSLYVNTNASFYSAVFFSIDLEYEHFLLSFTLLSEDETNQDAAPILMPISHQLDIAEKTFHSVQTAFPPDILTKWWSLVLTHSCRGSNSSNLYGQQLCSMLTDSPRFTPFVSFARKLGQFWIYEKENVFAARNVYEFAFKSTQGDIPIGPKISCKPMTEPEYVPLLQDLADVYKTLHQLKDAQALSDAIQECGYLNINQEKVSSLRPIIDHLPKEKWCTDGLLEIVAIMLSTVKSFESAKMNDRHFIKTKYTVNIILIDYFYLVSLCKNPDVAMEELQALEARFLIMKFGDIHIHSQVMLLMSNLWNRLHGNVSREVYWLEKAVSVLGDDPAIFSDTIKYAVHFRLARLYFTEFRNVSKALHHSQVAYDLVTKDSQTDIFGSLVLFKSVFRLAVLLFGNGSFNTSLQYFQQAANMLPHMYSYFQGDVYFFIQREIQMYLFKLFKVLDMRLDAAIGNYYQWYKREAKTSAVLFKKALDVIFGGSIFMSHETTLTLSNEPHVNAGSDILRLFKTVQLHAYAYSSYMWTQVLWILAFALLLSFVLLSLAISAISISISAISISLPAVCFLSLSSKAARLHYYIVILHFAFHYFLYCAIRNGRLWLPTRLPFLSVPLTVMYMISVPIIVIGCSSIPLAHHILSYSSLLSSSSELQVNSSMLFQKGFDEIPPALLL